MCVADSAFPSLTLPVTVKNTINTQAYQSTVYDTCHFIMFAVPFEITDSLMSQTGTRILAENPYLHK